MSFNSCNLFYLKNLRVLNSFQMLLRTTPFYKGLKRMRRLRQKSIPATPDNIEDLHTLLMANSQFTLTLQNPSNKFYQGPLLINQQIKGLIFCNISNIQLLAPELRNVRNVLNLKTKI
ncbi:unnamed protein product [Aphis gossypii]|uniref:Uncharacterized protein n=1 Tax=Aphis gossypii TaxID=80765 RepID=A0A9P0NEP6_APHGO|nr:unnamed protein product [Aphis gossypii]